MSQAECGNHTVDRFADGAPSLTKTPQISCRGASQFLAASSEAGECGDDEQIPNQSDR